MGLKKWFSLDFSKRDATSEPPAPPQQPSRKASNAVSRPPRSSYAQPPPSQSQSHPPPNQRRTSEARGSYYQTPRQHHQPIQEYSVDRRSGYDHETSGYRRSGYGEVNEHQRRHRQSNASSSQYHRGHAPPHVRPSFSAYQSESGYYFEENGIDEVERASTPVSNQNLDHLPNNQHYQQPRTSGRHREERGEPIVVKGLQRTTSLRMPPQPQQREQVPQQATQAPPSMRRVSSMAYGKQREQRSSRVGNQAPGSPPIKEHVEEPQRTSFFDAIRFSWLGLGRSDSANANRMSQLAAGTPRRSSLQRPVNEASEIVMKGWLDKCGQQFKTWKWRFFVLRADGVLAYYADEAMQKFKGSINVGYGSKADISMQSNLIEKRNVFMIATETRNMMISAPSQKMMTKWIAKLHAAGATPSEPWDPSKKVVPYFVRETETPHEWKRYDDPTSYIHMEGCLMKRGHVNKNWKNRFFRVERGELRYYTEGQEQLKGSVDLKGTIVSPGMTQSPEGLKNYFVLTSKDGKFEMHLSAPNEQTMHRWIEALQEAQTALGGKGAKDTVSGLALVVKHAEEIPLAKEEVVYESPELINVELERRMESLIVVSCRAGTVPLGSQLIAIGGRSILRDSYSTARHKLRAAACPLKLHFLVPPFKRGELIKKSRSGFENWKRRVFVLSNGELQYYKEVASSNATKTLKHRKTFPLYGCYLNLIQMPGREFCIIVARSPTDKLVLEARNEDERVEWASVIYCSIRMVSQGVTPGHIKNLQLEVAREPTVVRPSEINGSFKHNVPLIY
jgi:hypothetical protein